MLDSRGLKSFATLGVLCLSACASLGLGTSSTPKPPTIISAPDQQQEVFGTPEQAVETLIAATREDDDSELVKILGRRAKKLIHSGDKVADKESREKFLAAYDKAHKIDNENASRAVLVVGDEDWPMPIPLVRAHNGWWFDTAAGEDEILNRRIGRNELNVIEVCRAYVEAQHEFADQHPLDGHRHEFAQRFQSTDGQHDGLYWPAADGEPPSPLGPLLAAATAEGYDGKVPGKHEPYHGYLYRILKSQGSHAPSGAKDYIVDGHMVRGFALIAFPARYGDSGVMTFIVNRNGIVYEKNLGRDTARVADRITQFDPDGSWNIVRQ